jgi:hypothetical protein
MSGKSSTKLQVEGPSVDQETQEHRFIVHGDVRQIRFSVLPEELGGIKGWGVRIEGIPDPCIVHEQPWASVEAVCVCALRAIEDLLSLERMQREEQERLRPK